MKTPQFLKLGLALCAFSGLSADTIIDDFTDATNDRFTNDPDFIAAAYNLSAIGRIFNKWGTLVSQNVFLAANHYHPNIGQSLTFYATNDPAGPSETRKVATGQRLGNSDIWVGVLDSPMPANYVPFPIATEPLTGPIQFNNSIYNDAEAYLVGVSQTTPELALNMAVSRNTLTTLQNFNVAGNAPASGYAIQAIFDVNNVGDYVTYESYLQDQDSGAPMLVDVGGVLTLVGINWFISANTATPTRGTDYSASTYVGNFATEIQTIIDAYENATLSFEYGNWAATAFGGDTDISKQTPDGDYDEDGLANYDEYALAFDPIVSDHTATSSFTTNGNFGELTVKLQEIHSSLGYRIETGNDLDGWSSANVFYNGSIWKTNLAGIATVVGSTDHGDTWTITIRDSVAITEGTPRFMRLVYD